MGSKKPTAAGISGRKQISTPCTRLVRLGREFDTPVAKETARKFLSLTIVTLLAGALLNLLVVSATVDGPSPRMLASLLLTGIALLGRYLLARNQVKASGHVLVWGVWGAVTVQALLSGGVYAPVVIVYPVTILLAGWILRPSAALALAGCSIASTWVLAWWVQAPLHPSAVPALTALYAGVQSITYGLSAILVATLVRSHQRRLGNLHQVSHDLRLRKQDLQARTADMDRAQAVASVGSWVYDLANDTLRLSAEACRIFGVPQGTTANRKTYLARTHPDDRLDVERLWHTVQQETALTHEHRIVVGGGEVRWVRHKAQPGPHANGTGHSIVGTTQDITQHKQVQLALQESEQRYRTMTEWSPDPILVHRNERVLYVNAAAIRMFGARDAQDLVGRQTPELIHPDSLELQRARMHSIVNQEPIAAMVESQFLRLDGTAIDVEVQGTAIVYDGEPALHVSIRDITERKKAQAKIHELAFFDQLTGLPNRTLLMDRLRQALAASARSGHYCALLFADLDNFKTLNDTLGHGMGDLLLQQVAQRISGCVRAQDTVGRLGGDEFLVLLTQLSTNKHDALTQTETSGEKIRAALNQPFELDHFTHHCTPSIGATLFTGSQASVEEVLKQADLAMYKAKAAGRNTLRFFDVGMETVVQARTTLESELRQALQQQQFVLYYQPQVVDQGLVVGVEAVVRWRHPQRGTLLPDTFMALAHDSGLVVPLDQQVLALACHQLAQWSLRKDLAHLRMSVNISERQFRQHGFVEQLQALLATTGANPKQLTLEVTECLLLNHMDEAIATMQILREMGVGLALDDFGTGFSSLSCLSRLPLNQVKIDRSCVANLETQANAVAICAATIGLAHSLNMQVVAEGVETEAQRHFLQTQHRCDLLQGHLFSPALPLDAFERWINLH